MVPEEQLQEGGGGMRVFRPAGTPGALWVTGWTLITTAAIPAAMATAPVLAALLVGLINLGVKAGIWPSTRAFPAEGLGFVISLALMLPLGQGYLLRPILPRARLWILASGASILLGGLLIIIVIFGSSAQNLDPFLITAVALLSLGLALGLGQWLYLRRFLPKAFWIIPIDVLAAGSILAAGPTYTSPVELAVFLLPGAISGLGLWLLLGLARPETAIAAKPAAGRKENRRLPRAVRVGLALAALVPLFFMCSWAYAASQLALAKNSGVYPTVEQAIIANNREGFGGAQITRIENIHAGPNRRDAQPHVWFGGATVYMDRVPAGHQLDYYFSGSFYIHVKEGWVFVSEGAFPEFIGWVMELYHMEGVDR